MITLTHGDLSLCLAPEKGGCVTALTLNGKDILHPARPSFFTDEWKASDAAAFPMVPFIGRIKNGQFQYEGRPIHLPANMPPEPHAIHGFGWQSPWQIASQTESSVTLIHTHKAANWPWAYQASQTFTLTEETLSLTLGATNSGETKMPAGLGWHPYVSKAGAKLNLPVTSVWTGKNTPPERISLNDLTDLTHSRPVKGLNLDHAYDVSSPHATIETAAHRLHLESDQIFSKMTVFTPPEADFFCVEPITHAPDAVNMALPNTETGLVDLAPGETLSGTIRLKIKLLS